MVAARAVALNAFMGDKSTSHPFGRDALAHTIFSTRYNNNTWIGVLADTSTNTDTHPGNIRHDPGG